MAKWFSDNAEKDVPNADGYPMTAGKAWDDCKINSYSENKRGSFALQNMPFCNVKGHLLKCKRACFATQKGTFYNAKDALLKSNKEFILQKEYVTLFRIHIPIEFICYEIGPFNASPSE